MEMLLFFEFVFEREGRLLGQPAAQVLDRLPDVPALRLHARVR